MRLIDADALKRKLKQLAFDYFNEGRSFMVTDVVDNCIDITDWMPTIDPVRHGWWIKMSDGFYGCSNCGEWSKEMSNYCPNCGVKMGEEGIAMPINTELPSINLKRYSVHEIKKEDLIGDTPDFIDQLINDLMEGKKDETN